MPTLKEVRAGFKAVLTANIPQFGVYERVAGNVQVPCVVVMPTTSDFQMAFRRAVDEWYFDLHVLVSSSDDDVGQDLLDEYITGYGDRSIVDVLAANNTLGMSGVSLSPVGITAYNFRFDAVGTAHIGATLRVHVVLTNR